MPTPQQQTCLAAGRAEPRIIDVAGLSDLAVRKNPPGMRKHPRGVVGANQTSRSGRRVRDLGTTFARLSKGRRAVCSEKFYSRSWQAELRTDGSGQSSGSGRRKD
jgi:hypothetical protein